MQRQATTSRVHTPISSGRCPLATEKFCPTIR
jgi:hypothetical protein